MAAHEHTLNSPVNHHLTRRQALRSTAAAAVIALPAGGAMAAPVSAAVLSTAAIDALPAMAPVSRLQKLVNQFWTVLREWEQIDVEACPWPRDQIMDCSSRTYAAMEQIAATPITTNGEAIAVLDVAIERTGLARHTDPDDVVSVKCFAAVRGHLLPGGLGMSATTRRQLLGQSAMVASAAGLSAGVVLPALAATDPLVALGEEFDRLGAAVDADKESGEFGSSELAASEAKTASLWMVQDEVAGQIAAMKPSSLAGALVLVRVGRVYLDLDYHAIADRCFDGIATWLEGQPA